MNSIHRGVSRAALALGAALLAAVVLSATLPSPASAGPIGLQAAGGWYNSSGGDDFYVNGGARIGFGTLTVIPNLDWVFVENVTTYSLNVDGTFSLMPLGVASLYAGGGIGWLVTDTDFSDSQTETVVNLLAGVGLNAAPMKPFAQFKYIVLDGDDPLAFSIGVRF